MSKLFNLQDLIDECAETGESLRTVLLSKSLHWEIVKNEMICKIPQPVPIPANPNGGLRATIKKAVLECFNDNAQNYRKTALELGLPKSTVHDWVSKWKAENA